MVLKALNDEPTLFDVVASSAVGRSFPRRNLLTPTAAEILRRVLEFGSVPRNLEDEGLNLCYKMGWLHSEPLDTDGAEILCVFPSKLHEK